jgi:mono/diheme cytochrome c family protein
MFEWLKCQLTRSCSTMHRILATLAIIVVTSISPTVAQQPSPGGGGAPPLESGRAIYAAQCAFCHRANGVGMPPQTPALAGNRQLHDTELVVRTIHFGRGAMPAFPHLSTDDIAAVASYIRSNWGNGFGAVGSAEAAAATDGGHQPGPTTSVWEGVFTRVQAERGQRVHRTACAECHGTRLDGAPLDPDRASTPPLARARFLRVWDGRSIAALIAYMRVSMPPSSPGSLSDDEYIDAIAHMLAVSNVPAGERPLEADALALTGILIRMQPQR